MKTRRIAYISIFTALTIVGGFIKVPILPNVLYFSMQSFVVIMSGFFLNPNDAFFAQFAYVILGLIGVPVFTQGGGIGYVFMPSFGYLLGFMIGGFITSKIRLRQKTLSTVKLFLSGLCGLVFIYTIGSIYQVLIMWLYLQNSLSASFATLVPVIILFTIDCFLVYLLSLIYPKILTMIGLVEYNQKSKV